MLKFIISSFFYKEKTLGLVLDSVYQMLILFTNSDTQLRQSPIYIPIIPSSTAIRSAHIAIQANIT